MSLTKRTLGEVDKRGIGAARNADKFVEPSLARGAEGARGAIPRVEKLLLQNSIEKNEFEQRVDHGDVFFSGRLGKTSTCLIVEKQANKQSVAFVDVIRNSSMDGA